MCGASVGGGGGVNIGDEKGGGEWTDEATVGLTEDWERKSWGSGVPLATRETAEERSLAVAKRSSRCLAIARIITCSKSLGRSGLTSKT